MYRSVKIINIHLNTSSLKYMEELVVWQDEHINKSLAFGEL